MNTTKQLPEDKQLNPSVLMFNINRQHEFELKNKRKRFCQIELTGKETPKERRDIAAKEIRRIKNTAEHSNINAKNFTASTRCRGLILHINYIEAY